MLPQPKSDASNSVRQAYIVDQEDQGMSEQDEDASEVWMGKKLSLLHPDGIVFELPPDERTQYSGAMLTALRRMHINCGHPPNHDLERIVRSAGGLPEAVRACIFMRCSVCEKLQRPAISRPRRVPHDNLEFNERVLVDQFQIHDSQGNAWWMMAMVDVATDDVVIKPLKRHTSERFWKVLQSGWLSWAGPPDYLTSDGERGLVSEEVADKLGQNGTQMVPTVACAPWQKARVERNIQLIRHLFATVVVQKGLQGRQAAKDCAWEIAHVANNRPGGNGLPASFRLFGRGQRQYGCLYHQGDPQHLHPEVADPASEVSRRLAIRRIAQEVADQYEATELAARAVVARGRPLRLYEPGYRVFFYRSHPGRRKNELIEGKWLGPALIIGPQHSGTKSLRGSYWLQFGGRCYIVAAEHLRGLTSDEDSMHDPTVAEEVQKLRRALEEGGMEAEDVTRQEVLEGHLEEAARDPPGEDVDDYFGLPIAYHQIVNQVGWQITGGEPVVVDRDPWTLPRLPERFQTTEFPLRAVYVRRRAGWALFHERIPWEPRTPEQERVPRVRGQELKVLAIFHRASPTTENDDMPPASVHDDDTEDEADSVVVRIRETRRSEKQEGRRPNAPRLASSSAIASSSANYAHGCYAAQKGNKAQASSLLSKRQADTELAWGQIDPTDRPLFEEAERKQWAEWCDFGSVRILSREESRKVRSRVRRSRILRSR